MIPHRGYLSFDALGVGIAIGIGIETEF